MAGKVYITGAGPGDELLITLKAVQCLQKADVLVYDYLANPVFLSYCKSDCLLIYAGKKANQHTLKQEEINALLVEHASLGKTVVRLKGGDPFVFGRGGEEALALAENNIEFEVIPGVTSGIAAPAYSGIPVTQRGYGSMLTLITGHESADKEISDIDWPALGQLKSTLVFYMGVRNLPEISSNLIQYGKSQQTPVALIRWGTTPQQQTLVGTLADIAEKVQQANFQPPALIVVGEVVSLRDSLQWFENKPLFGKRILVTRSRSQASVLSHKLQQLGAEVVELPTIDIQPCEDYSALQASISSISTYKWIVFTSVNAVDIFMEQLAESERDLRCLYACKLAVIGNETAKRLLHFGLKSDVVPSVFTSEGLVAAFSSIKEELKGANVLLPASDIARDVIHEGLKSFGAEVSYIPVYRTVAPKYDTDFLEKQFEKQFDCVTFTSSSTVTNLCALLQQHHLEHCIGDLEAVSIGPVTSQTAQAMGVSVLAEANPHTIDALVEAVCRTLITTK